MRPIYLDVKKTKNNNYFRQMDYLILALVLLLSGIGIFVLSSALASFDDGQAMLLKQLTFMIVGFVIAILLARFDYSDYKVLGFLLYVASTVLLLSVKFFSVSINGSTSWLKFPVIGSFQPSEIAKITFIMVVAVFLARIKDGQGKTFVNLIKLVIYASIPILLIVDQPDYGTAMVFLFILLCMLYIVGVKLRYFLLFAVGSTPVLLFVWFFLLSNLRKNRILTFLNPSLVSDDSVYQIKRSITTIGSGQLYGKGLFGGPQTQKAVVPIKVSDFIFTVVGEELGFIGVLIVISLFILLLVRCIYVAQHSRDTYGTLLITGITGMIGFHFIQNIGMCIGIMPITGIPLPFFSLGNSAMLTNFIAVGIILSVSMRKRKTL